MMERAFSVGPYTIDVSEITLEGRILDIVNITTNYFL